MLQTFRRVCRDLCRLQNTNRRFIAVSEPLVFCFFLRCTQILSLIFDQFHLMKLLFLELNLIRRGLNTRCATSEPRWRLISSFFSCFFTLVIFSSQQLSFNFPSECFLFQSTAISTWITLARLGCWRSCETRVCLTNSRSSRRVVCVTFKVRLTSRRDSSLLFPLCSC